MGKVFSALKEWATSKKIVVPDEEILPVVKPRFSPKNSSSKENKVRVTWLGHSTCYVQLEPLNVCFITDPQFSYRASPVQWMGPKRIRRIPCEISDLPKIDFVLLSHNHYDHMDYDSIKQLFERFNPVFYVPLKNKSWFVSTFGKEIKVVELDWWEENDFSDLVKIHCFPCQHFSSRGMMDRDKSLWGSFGIEVKRNENEILKFYFAGDTGYNEVCFKQIGEKFGPVDFGLIPIGAYEPRIFMKRVHVNPEESVKIAKDVKSKKNIGIHWGTFTLTTEPVLDPPKELLKEVAKMKGVEDDFFVSLHHGETKIYDV